MVILYIEVKQILCIRLVSPANSLVSSSRWVTCQTLSINKLYFTPVVCCCFASLPLATPLNKKVVIQLLACDVFDWLQWAAPFMNKDTPCPSSIFSSKYNHWFLGRKFSRVFTDKPEPSLRWAELRHDVQSCRVSNVRSVYVLYALATAFSRCSNLSLLLRRLARFPSLKDQLAVSAGSERSWTSKPTVVVSAGRVSTGSTESDWPQFSVREL